jgi:hypothetical protein
MYAYICITARHPLSAISGRIRSRDDQESIRSLENIESNP